MLGLFEDGRERPAHKVALPSAKRLGGHLIELCELQGRLLLADTKAASRRLLWFAILAIIGAVVLLGAVPVALHALGMYFASAFDWSESAGLALSAGMAAVVGAILLAVAVTVVRAGIARFGRSRSEFNQNLEMLKKVVSSPTARSEDNF
jgi:hypothetical protein